MQSCVGSLKSMEWADMNRACWEERKYVQEFVKN